jgi:hypothetical protein
MPSYKEHFKIMQEKKEKCYQSYNQEIFSVVGDLAIKVVEQAIEADAAKNFKRHLGGHRERINYAEQHISKQAAKNIKELFSIYSRLGYDGRNGIRAKRAVALVSSILKTLERRWGENIGTQYSERP